jgi:hypothetical protein
MDEGFGEEEFEDRVEDEKEGEKDQHKYSKKLLALIEQCLEKFYEVMNSLAKDLGLKKSKFASAHGMYNENNFSTAHDLARLCFHSMKNDRFRQIVKCSSHEVKSRTV